VLIHRIASLRYPVNDGQGAAKFGGRWNFKGTPIIYASESRALCALEILANKRELAGDYIAIPIEVPDDLRRTVLEVRDLPEHWDAAESTDATRELGTKWTAAVETAILEVPSAVIPRERTYLLNPRHADFVRIRFLAPESFRFDPRLAKR
jgi:RES domain-containing protein